MQAETYWVSCHRALRLQLRADRSQIAGKHGPQIYMKTIFVAIPASSPGTLHLTSFTLPKPPTSFLSPRLLQTSALAPSVVATGMPRTELQVAYASLRPSGHTIGGVEVTSYCTSLGSSWRCDPEMSCFSHPLSLATKQFPLAATRRGILSSGIPPEVCFAGKTLASGP